MTPQSQFKNNSRATVPLRLQYSKLSCIIKLIDFLFYFSHVVGHCGGLPAIPLLSHGYRGPSLTLDIPVLCVCVLLRVGMSPTIFYSFTFHFWVYLPTYLPTSAPDPARSESFCRIRPKNGIKQIINLINSIDMF